jgi:hypothetical protein
VWIDAETRRIEPADHLLVSYLCADGLRQRRIVTVDVQGRQPYRHAQAIQLL